MWLSKLRPRQWIAGLLAIAAVGVAIAVYFYPTAAALDAKAMATYFPEREATVAFIDVSAIRDSGLMEKIIGSTVAEESEYRSFVEQTGFDYKRDLDRAMLNSAGGVHYFLLQGRFDWDKLRDYARNSGGRCEGDLCSMQGSTPERIISFRPLHRNVMALATAPDASGATAISQRPTVPTKWDIPDQPVWVHVPSQALQAATELPAGMRLFAKALAPAEHVLFALGPAEDKFGLTMNVTCRTAEDAAVLKAQLEGLTNLLQRLISRENQQPNPKDFSGILTSGTFNRDYRNVIGKWSVERGFIESLGGS